MLPGDAPTSLPLAYRIVIALNELRRARSQGDPLAELEWQTKLDHLLDRYPRGSA